MLPPYKRIYIQDPTQAVAPASLHLYEFLHILTNPFDYVPDTVDDGPNFRAYKHKQHALLLKLAGLPQNTHFGAGIYCRDGPRFFSNSSRSKFLFLSDINMPLYANYAFCYNISYNGLSNVLAGCVHNSALLLWLKHS
jgi:hypothetical protein